MRAAFVARVNAEFDLLKSVGDNGRMTAGEAPHRECSTERQPQNRREKDRGETHTQRKRDDSDERGIARQNKPPSCSKGVGDIVQGGASSA